MTSADLDPRRWKALAALGVAFLMVVLDISIVNVALPSIQTDLGFSPADTLLSPSAFSIVTATFPEGPERNKALGMLGAVAASGAAVGALLGGVLTQYAGWEWIFFVNVPTR